MSTTQRPGRIPHARCARPKVLGCGTRRDKAGRMRDTPRCLLWFCEAPRPDGVQDFCPAFSPLRRLSRGGGRFCPPGKACLQGLCGPFEGSAVGGMAGRLERIWRKRCRRGPMDPRSRVELRAGAGLVDDAKQSRTRQVTIVSRERWKAVAEALGQHVDPVLRRANLLISGVDLENSRGNILRVGSSARQRRNAPVRADGRTAARLARGAASPMGRRGLRLGPRGREDCGRGSRRGGARCTPEARAVIESSESAAAETPRGKPRPSSAQISPTASSRAPSHPGPRFGTLAGQSPRTCVTRLPSWAPPRAPRRTPRGPQVRSPSDLLADAERPPAVRTP